MSRPVVVLRPEPGNAETCEAARAAGLDPVEAPLFAIDPLAWHPPDPAGFDAVLLGSANALRHGGRALRRFAGLPAYAVGASTAAAARAAGFTVAATGEAGIEALLPRLIGDGRRRILRVAGAAHVVLDPPREATIATAIVYRARGLELAGGAVEALRRGAIALLHSAAAAHRFAEECTRHELGRAAIGLACLGPRVAAAAGSGWQEVACAARPTDPALLALARGMCQTDRSGVAHQR